MAAKRGKAKPKRWKLATAKKRRRRRKAVCRLRRDPAGEATLRSVVRQAFDEAIDDVVAARHQLASDKLVIHHEEPQQEHGAAKDDRFTRLADVIVDIARVSRVQVNYMERFAQAVRSLAS